MSWLFQSFILLMKFITGPSENLKNSLILTLLHLCPNCCPRVSKCFPLLKKKLVCFYIIAVFYNKIKNHLWNPRSNRKSISPEQTKSMNMCSQKGLFYTSYSMRGGGVGEKINKNHPIASPPSINKFTPLSQEANPFNKYQRELRGAGIPGGKEEQQQLCAMPAGCRAAPRVSPGR